MIGTPAILGQLSKRFQHEDLFITDVVSKVDKAKLHLEALKDGGECYKSFFSKHDTRSNHSRCGKYGEQVVTLLKPGVNSEGNFNRLLNNIYKYMDQRFRSLKPPPVSCFQVFDFRFWPPSWWCWHQDTGGPLFKYFFPEETTESSVLDQCLDWKLSISQPIQRESKPQERYFSILPTKLTTLRAFFQLLRSRQFC